MRELKRNFKLVFFPCLSCNPIPLSSPQSWDVYFRNTMAGAAPGEAYIRPPSLSHSLSTELSPSLSPGVRDTKMVEEHLAVQSLVRAYQVRTTGNAKLLYSTSTSIFKWTAQLFSMTGRNKNLNIQEHWWNRSCKRCAFVCLPHKGLCFPCSAMIIPRGRNDQICTMMN